MDIHIESEQLEASQSCLDQWQMHLTRVCSIVEKVGCMVEDIKVRREPPERLRQNRSRSRA